MHFDPHCAESPWRHQRSGPHLRWENVFVKCFGDHWKGQAATSTWKGLLGAFRSKAHALFGTRSLEERFGSKKSANTAQASCPAAKKPRAVARQTFRFAASFQRRRLEIIGDSKLVIGWLNGVWRCKYRVCDARLDLLHGALEELERRHSAWPRTDDADWGRHIFRELNTEADALASRHAHSYALYTSAFDFNIFRLYFDGSAADTGSGCGWVLYAAKEAAQDRVEDWTKVADMSFPLGASATVTAAELEACFCGVSYLLASPDGRAEHFCRTWTPLDTKRFEILEVAGFID